MSIIGNIRIINNMLLRLEKSIIDFPHLDKNLKESESFLHISIQQLHDDYEEVKRLESEIVATGDESIFLTSEYFQNSLFEKYRQKTLNTFLFYKIS